MAAFFLVMLMMIDSSYMNVWAVETPQLEQQTQEEEIDEEQAKDSTIASEVNQSDAEETTSEPATESTSQTDSQPTTQPTTESVSQSDSPSTSQSAAESTQQIDDLPDSEPEEEEVPVQAEETEIIKQGKCGQNAFYDLDSNGVLTISGTGNMFNYSYSGYEWNSKSSEIKEVVIQKSVSNIGNYAFQGCTNLTSITIPDSVTSIGSSAFSNCTSLTSVTIPDSVTSIGNSSFSNCTNLTSVTIPNSVTSIGSSAFYYCSKLNEVHITDLSKWCKISFANNLANPLFYAKNLYLKDQLITDLVIPDGVTSIGSSVFYNCMNLTSVTIPDSVTSIGNYAFFNCTNLTSITISDSVTSIGESAFRSCVKLTSITIPDSVMSIERYAFSDCTNLTSVTIPDSVTSIGSSAFYYCSKLNEVYITDLSKWCSIRFYDQHANPLFWAKNLYLQDELVTSLVIPDSVTSISNYAFSNYSNLTSVTIPDSVTSIGSSVFYNCSNLTSVTIPDSVISIGGYAFYNCSNLTSVTIPDSVTSIGSYAFYNCSNLNKVYITDLSKWCSISFEDNSANPLYYARNLYLNNQLVTDLVIPDSITSIGKSAFYFCTSLTSVTIPNNITSIGESAFYSCTGLTSVMIPDSVTTIENSAFNSCNLLKKIEFEGNAPAISNTAFYNVRADAYYYPWKNWTSSDLKSYGGTLTWHEYGEKGNITSLTINTMPNITTYAKNEEFNSEGLTLKAVYDSGKECVVYPQQMEFKYDFSSYGKKNVAISYEGKTIELAVNVEFIKVSVDASAYQSDHNYSNNLNEYYEYSSPGADKIILKFDSRCKFENNYDYLIIYDKNNKQLGKYTDTQLSNQKIEIKGDYFKLYFHTDASGAYWGFAVLNINVYTTADTVLKNAKWNLSEDGQLTISGDGALEAFTNKTAPWYAEREKITSVFFEGNFTKLYGTAERIHSLFEDCTNLKTIRFSSQAVPIICENETDETQSEDSIKQFFSGVNKIKIFVPYQAKSKYEAAWKNALTDTAEIQQFGTCGSQINWTLDSAGILTINGTGAMRKDFDSSSFHNSINKVVIKDGVTAISNSAFYNCTKLTEVSIPNSVKSIGSSAFYGCTGLTEVSIPNNVTSINSSTFANCSNLTRVEFGNGLKRLYASTTDSYNIFYGCSKLTELAFDSAIVPILNSSSYSSSTDSNCAKKFFSTNVVPSLQKIYVPGASFDTYKSAWASYLPDTVKILPYGITEDIQISLTFVSASSKQIRFKWNKLETADSYEIYRDGEKIATTKEINYTDNNLEVGSSHKYAVIAVQGNVHTTAKEFTFATIMPTVTNVRGGVDNWMNETYNELQAVIPNQSNFENASGVFIVNGKTLNATAKVDKDSVLYSTEWDISEMTVPAGSYDVKFILTDVDGTTAEKTQQVTVDYSVPKPITGVTTVGDTQSITLSWNISYEAVTNQYLIYRADSEESEFKLVKTIINRDTLSYTDYNLNYGQTYYYYILGKNKLNVTGDASKAMHVSAVAQKDTEKPTISSLTPSQNTRVNGKNVAIKATSADNIAVKRTELYYASADDKAASEIENWITIKSQNDSLCMATLDTTKLKEGNVYIKAVSYDTSNNVSDPMYRTLVIDNTGPNKVEDFKIKIDEKTGKPLLTATSVILTWSDLDDNITNNHDRAGFIVEQKNSDNTFTEVKRVQTIGAEIKGLSAGTSYVFRVRGYDDLGNLGTPSYELDVTTSSDTSAPVITKIQPESATYGNTLPLKVTATDNSDVVKIVILYSTDKKTWHEYGEAITFDGTKSEVTASVDVDLRNIKEGKVSFGAIAYDSANNASGLITSYTNPYVEYNIDHTPPAEPTNFAAEADLGKIVLSWAKGSEQDLKGYNIYRAESENAENFKKLANCIAYTGYEDTEISANTTYWYKISAIDNAGNESVITKAVGVMAQVDTEKPTIAAYSPESEVLGGSGVRFGVNAKDNWKISNVKIQYQVNDGEIKNGSDQSFSAASVTASATISLDKMKDGDILKFIVTVTDAQGLQTIQPYVYSIDKSAPVINGLTSFGGENGTSIHLTWKSGGEKDLRQYNIYRIAENGSSSYIASTSIPSYTDTNIQPRMLYHYRVEAVDKCGNTSFAEVKNARSTPVYAVLNCDTALSTGAEYIFDAASSSASSEIKTYCFDFGDKTIQTGTERSVIHTYEKEGTYTVKLTVTDANNNHDTITRQVIVKNPSYIGKTTIKVVDADNNPLVGAKVYFDYDKNLDNCKVANNSGNVVFSAEAGRYVIGIYYNSEYLPVKKTISVLPNTESEVTVVLSKQDIVSGDFSTNRVSLDELKKKYDIDPTAPANRDYVEVNVSMVFGEKKVNMVVVSDGWSNFNYNEVNSQIVDDRVLTPIYIPLKDSSTSPEPNKAGFVAVLDVPVNATYTKEFFDVKLHIMNNASKEFTMTNNKVSLKVESDNRDENSSVIDPNTGLVLIESPATSNSKDVAFGDLKGQETKTLEWLFRGDKEGYYKLTANYTGLLKEFNENISATFKTNDPIHVYGASSLNMNVDIAGKVQEGKVNFTLGLKNVTPDNTINVPTLDITENIIEASKCIPEDNGKLISVDAWKLGAKITREYIKKADGTIVDVSNVNELKPGETYCKDYGIDISASDIMAYAKNLQAVIKEIGKEHGIKTNIFVDGIEAEHKFVNYRSDNNATCFKDGTKTAVCENGCGTKNTVVDVGSKDKVPHHFVNGICANEGCGKQMQVKVAFLTRLGGANEAPETYSYDTKVENIVIKAASVEYGYDYKGWTLNGKLYTDDSELQKAIYDLFNKEYSITGDFVTIQPQATYEKRSNRYKLAIEGGALKNGSTEGTFEQDAKVYVYANKAPEGMFFDHWERNGVKVSNISSYNFFMPSLDVTLKAVYAKEEKEQLGVVCVERVTGYENQNQLEFVHTYTIPVTSKNVTAGVLATCNEDEKDLLELDKLPSHTGNYIKKKSVSTANYRYTWSKGKVSADQVWYVRGYITYTDSNGKKQTIYGKRIRSTLSGEYTSD